jgi:hypothetical protein
LSFLQADIREVEIRLPAIDLVGYSPRICEGGKEPAARKDVGAARAEIVQSFRDLAHDRLRGGLALLGMPAQDVQVVWEGNRRRVVAAVHEHPPRLPIIEEHACAATGVLHGSAPPLPASAITVRLFPRMYHLSFALPRKIQIEKTSPNRSGLDRNETAVPRRPGKPVGYLAWKSIQVGEDTPHRASPVMR